MNKKGAITEIIGVIALALVVLIVVAGVSSEGNSTLANIFNNLGINSWGEVFTNLHTFLVSIKDTLFQIAVPAGAGLNADQEVIAFAVFLLIWLIGTHALNDGLKKPITSFLVAGLISLIAARSLSATIIDNYISGSPVASAAFLVGIIPLYFFYSFMQRWKTGKIIPKFLVWCILAITYLMVFAYGFNNKTLGITYSIAILIAGFIELITIFITAYGRTKGNMDLGKFLAMEHGDYVNWDQTYRAAAAAATGPFVHPTAPWEHP